MSDPIDVAASALDVIFAEEVEGLRTVLPIHVVAWVPGTAVLPATCEATPAVPDRLPDGTANAPALLSARPVWYPGGSGFFIHWPMTLDDQALGLVSDRSLAAWSLSRAPGPQSAPTFPHYHNISDTQALPFTDLPGVPAADPGLATDFKIGSTAGVAIRVTQLGEVTIETAAATVTVAVDGTITLDGVTVKLGGVAAALGVARLNDTTSSDVTMTAWMAGVQTVSSAAAALLGLTPPVYPSDFGKVTAASTKVLSE